MANSPIKKEYHNLKKINQKLKNESDLISTKTDEIFSYLGVEKSAFKKMNSSHKLEKLLFCIKNQSYQGRSILLETEENDIRRETSCDEFIDSEVSYHFFVVINFKIAKSKSERIGRCEKDNCL